MAIEERKPAHDDQVTDDIPIANLPEPADDTGKVKGGALTRGAGAISDIDSGIKRAVDL
jgi:hypothetical protein